MELAWMQSYFKRNRCKGYFCQIICITCCKCWGDYYIPGSADEFIFDFPRLFRRRKFNSNVSFILRHHPNDVIATPWKPPPSGRYAKYSKRKLKNLLEDWVWEIIKMMIFAMEKLNCLQANFKGWNNFILWLFFLSFPLEKWKTSFSYILSPWLFEK